MKCPICPGHLRRIVYEGVQLDRCRLCFGLWFDKGELEHFSRDDPAFERSGNEPLTARQTKHRCPKCRAFLLECPHAPGELFLVERCPVCQGVWLDPVRVAHIRKLAAAGAGSPRGAGPADPQAGQRAAGTLAEIERTEARKELSIGGWLFLFLTQLPREVYNPVNRFPTVTVVLIGINVLAFLLEALVLAAAGSNAPEVISRYAFVPDRFRHVRDSWTIVTAMFLHGGIAHLLGNMYFLYTFGDNVEDYMGGAAFSVLYLLSGAFGQFTEFVANPQSVVPSIGASGAISGVLGAYLLLFAHRKIYLMIIVWPLRLEAVWFLGAWVAWQLLAAGTSTPGTPDVGWLAHAGGFFAGVALVVVYQAFKRT